ncbi:SDR family oxidoreductase [Chitinophaga horti]|uniref:SDR family oxidoreductase n=1 Tax=Chitinophaga horti TaxID=2920382 RepID=A0ABY6IUF8_9BACT|nr:SDR family oxidoreductase [Chitinophaga horti]UYQ91008.1 SDR family oxidoreductase [Chitinophaga horti]
MKLIIFGATGGTGKHLVTQALEQGHQVTAFVRDPSRLQLHHPQLTTVKGDVLNPASVAAAIKGHDAVLNTIGAPPNKTGVLRSEGTYNIIRGMESNDVNRLVCQTSLGYGDSRKVLDRTPFYFKYLIVPLLLKKGFADHALQEEHVKHSTLEWTIVRPGNLTDGPLTRNYKHGFPANDNTIAVKVSRADVADFMLKQLTTKVYLRKTAGISY